MRNGRELELENGSNGRVTPLSGSPRQGVFYGEELPRVRSGSGSSQRDINSYGFLDPSYSPKVLSRTRVLERIETLQDVPNESRVLVLYTGGTIGMIRSCHGYKPESNMLENKIRTYPQLHDPIYCDTNYSDGGRNSPHGMPLILPETGEEDPFRVVYTVLEYEPLLDSANMTMDDWVRIALDIKENYEHFDGFVILHGTDTMAYTASALSFMLENLGKTVVITGSQIPLFEPRSDGRENFLNALVIAGNYRIPEVTLLFSNKLFRGNRTSKVSASTLDAFNSPNMPPLATIGIKIHVDWSNVYQSTMNIEKFSVHEKLSRNVGLLRLFPSITVEVVRAFLTPPIEGVVLQTYGAGNGPSHRRDLLDELKRACQRGVIIVNCTQCLEGRVENSYETGNALSECGVIPGSDLTPEAALTKLGYVLSKKEWSVQTRRLMMQANLRGELTVAKEVRLEDLDIITELMKAMKVSSSDEIQALRDALYPVILCTLAAKGDLEKLEIMRQFGAYLSTCDYEYRTPLHIAVSEGNLKVVEYLLLHGSSVHMRDRFYKTPLMNAIEGDHHEVILLLKKAGGFINLPPTHIGEHLGAAIRRNDLKRVKSFQMAGMTLNEADPCQRTPLHVAVEMNSEEIVRYLLEQGVDIDCCDVYGRTAKDIARALGHENLSNIFTQKEGRKTSVVDLLESE